jgi:PTH1 family peptidyl-tRNA hydrolase
MAEAEYLVAGLGNPGPEYENTPHNLGFLTVNLLAGRAQARLSRFECRALVGVAVLEGKRVLLAQPQTYMNLSGESVNGLASKYGFAPERVVLVYDDLDLPWGTIRIRPDGSAGGHHGVEDVIRCLGTQTFPRVRMGIHPGHEVRDGAKFVLAQFKGGQKKELDSFIGQAADAVESIIAGGVEKAMAAHNRRAPGARKEEQ